MKNNRFGGLRNIKSRFDGLISRLGKFFKSKGYKDNYNLWEAMHSNEIGSSRSKQTRSRNAVTWLKKFVRNNKDAQVRGEYLTQSMLYMFNYDDPKYKDNLTVLPYFDTQPLVLIMGVVDTNEGKREIGINLHMLPEQVRKTVLYKIYTVYRIEYDKAMKRSSSTNFRMSWQEIYSINKALGVGFAVRMYIPDRRKNVIQFPLEEWERAIWIPSKGYSGISVMELEKEWKKYIIRHKKSESQRLASEDSHLI